MPSYAAAKGGLAQLTKALANEWAVARHQRQRHRARLHGDRQHRAAPRRRVRSRQILERIPAGRWGEPADVAGAAVFLSSPASDYVNGHILVVDGGWLAR